MGYRYFVMKAKKEEVVEFARELVRQVNKQSDRKTLGVCVPLGKPSKAWIEKCTMAGGEVLDIQYEIEEDKSNG